MGGLPGTVKLEQIVMEAGLDGDIAPVLASAPSMLSAISDANKIQVAIINGGPVVQTQGWKWNRFFPTPFLSNSWQQDYASNTLNIGWLENTQAIDVNNTSVPKPAIDVYAVKDLTITNVVAYPRYICWLPNNLLQYGSWGAAALNNVFGLTNPGPLVVYTNLFGGNKTPSNPINQVADAFGNFWRVNVFDNSQTPLTATCGSTNPFATNLSPTYPTLANPSATATVVTDGTVTWQAINPYAQGFRCSPIPSQTGRVWGIRPVAQAKPIQYTSLESYITPIPDELYSYFLDGFKIVNGMKATDTKVRAKYQAMYPMWIQSLDNAVRTGNREPDNFMFLPTNPVVQPAWGYASPRPDFPYGGPTSW